MTETADAIDLDLYPNEASDLAVVPGGLVAVYDQTFVTVLDVRGRSRPVRRGGATPE